MNPLRGVGVVIAVLTEGNTTGGTVMLGAPLVIV